MNSVTFSYHAGDFPSRLEFCGVPGLFLGVGFFTSFPVISICRTCCLGHLGFAFLFGFFFSAHPRMPHIKTLN